MSDTILQLPAGRSGRRSIIEVAEADFRPVEQARKDYRAAISLPINPECFRVAVAIAEQRFLATCRVLNLIACEGLCGAFAINAEDVDIERTLCEIATVCPECRHDHERMCTDIRCRPVAEPDDWPQVGL